MFFYEEGTIEGLIPEIGLSEEYGGRLYAGDTIDRTKRYRCENGFVLTLGLTIGIERVSLDDFLLTGIGDAVKIGIFLRDIDKRICSIFLDIFGSGIDAFAAPDPDDDPDEFISGQESLRTEEVILSVAYHPSIVHELEIRIP